MLLGVAGTASAWDPGEFDHVGLWLDAADTDTITLSETTLLQWNDKSGMERHAGLGQVSSHPEYATNVLNGLPAVRFNALGGTQQLTVDLDFLAGTSHVAFAVVKPLWGGPLYGANGSGLGSNSLAVGFLDGGAYRLDIQNNPYQPWYTANHTMGAFNIVAFHWPVGGHHAVYANGGLEGTNALAALELGTMGFALGFLSGGGRIGKGAADSSAYFNGDLAELIICTGAVSSAEQVLFEAYLSAKWGVPLVTATNIVPKTPDAPIIKVY